MALTAPRPDWFPDWSGQPCLLVGSGPSASAQAIEPFRGRARVMVVNTSFRLAPWADALYASDGRWWDAYPDAIGFSGLKITQDAAAAKHHGLHLVRLVEQGKAANAIQMAEPGLLGRGNNGGFHVFNLALQFGARRIALIGFDFHGEHWHGRHPAGLNNAAPYSLKEWAAILDAQATAVAALGAAIVNLSPGSLLKAYPKVSPEWLLANELAA